MKMIAFVLMILLPVFSFGGESEVFHCQDERGRLTWSDRPCSDDLEFIGMATIRTFEQRKPSAPTNNNEQAEEKERTVNVKPDKGMVVTSTVDENKDCEKSEDQGPWLNPVGLEDC